MCSHTHSQSSGHGRCASSLHYWAGIRSYLKQMVDDCVKHLEFQCGIFTGDARICSDLYGSIIQRAPYDQCPAGWYSMSLDHVWKHGACYLVLTLCWTNVPQYCFMAWATFFLSPWQLGLSLWRHGHRLLAKRLMHMANKTGNTSGVSKSSLDWLNVCHVI